MPRQDRIDALEQTVNEYITAEKKRIENEVSVLQAILDGRTGGKGVQKTGTDVVSAVAQKDLAAYLVGD